MNANRNLNENNPNQNIVGEGIDKRIVVLALECNPSQRVQNEQTQRAHLKSENSRLQLENKEFNAICNMSRQQHRMEIGSTSRSSVTIERQRITSVVDAAIEELTTMVQMVEPLWDPIPNWNGEHVLNEEQYLRRFSENGLRPIPAGFIRQASRHVSSVPMDPIHLVEMFMDTAKWSEMFSGLVSSAISAGSLSEGLPEKQNRSVKVIIAELQVLSPLMPVRREIFNRCCEQHSSGTWVVVDFSTENLIATPPINIWKRPSGCLIEKSGGGSKVTWVEHVQTAPEDTNTSIWFEKQLQDGLAFGAKRWISTLARECDRKASLATLPILTTLRHEGKRCMMKLAERMMNTFYGGIQPSSAQKWRVVAGIIGEGGVQVMTCHNATGLLLTAATSFWLPLPPTRVFSFLYRTQYLNQFNIMSNMTAERTLVAIDTGKGCDGSSITLLEGKSQFGIKSWTLQESRAERTGYQLVYAVVDDKIIMEKVLSGQDLDNVPLLPSGFAILPDGRQQESINGTLESSGSILTASSQFMAAKLVPGLIQGISNFMTQIIQEIKDNVM